MTTSRTWGGYRLGAFLDDALGDPMGAEVFTGLLAATGAALLRGGRSLVQDPPGAGALLLADLGAHPPIAVRVAPAVFVAGLDTGLSAVLAACARRRRAGGRPPWCDDLLTDLADAARDRVSAPDGGRLRLHGVRLHGGPPPDGPDWRDDVARLLVCGRIGLPTVAAAAAAVPDPPWTPGLRDVDRRALLALRAFVVARCEGREPGGGRHPDPDVRALRARLSADLAGAVDEARPPDPDSPAYILAAVLAPEAVQRSGCAPAAWHGWLATP